MIEKSLSGILDLVNSSEDGAGAPVTFNLLRNFTIEGIEPFIQYHCLLSDLKPKIIFGNYDMVHQEVLDKSSHLYSSSPDIIVLSLYLDTYLPDGWRACWIAEDVMSTLVGLFSDISRNTHAIIAVNTFIPPFYTDFGISTVKDSTSHHNEVVKLNGFIRDFVLELPSRFILIDWERFLRILGSNESIDYRFWYMSKSPFKKNFLDMYAQELVKVARALKGKSKKCLILDCDNTLWGGVVGEDGLQGIKLSSHSYPGNIFLDFQKSVVKLQERGILIAICSKNNEQDVWDVFDDHADCLLKREHLSSWRINWNDKASNIRSMADELNLGLDSFVFIDDNPVECGLIKNMLPEVTVLQVPEKLYSYPQLLNRDGLFDTLSISNEDRQRSVLYRNDSHRKQEQKKFETLEQYLESLSLSITVHEVIGDEIPRVAQLTQKTNQFNVTTRRYSEANISAFCGSNDCKVLSLTVRDKFGDSGLTGIFIARKEGHRGIIDSFLLSCRVLGRNIERSFFTHALTIVERAWGELNWRAEYIPTLKNKQVSELWPSFGFEKIEEVDGHAIFELPINTRRLDLITYISIEE